MKWVTRSYAYLDRIASPWLIKRFVDPDAVFVFVEWGRESEAPRDAIPFALAGGPLSEHDERGRGTTFEKILAEYGLTDPSLQRLGRILARGVDYRMNGEPESTDADGSIALALMALSEGMMLLETDDAAIVDRSCVIYDALYATFRARDYLERSGQTLPPSAGKGPTHRTEFLRNVIATISKEQRAT